MTPEDLETVIAATPSVFRLRWLTSDANPDAESREDHRRYVRETAAGKPLPAGAAPASLAPTDMTPWRRAVRLGGLRCFYASKDSDCGCNGFRCHAVGRLISLAECRDCLGPPKD